MLAIVGTVPEKDFPLVSGEITMEDGKVVIGKERVPVNRGTAALMGAAVKTLELVRQTPPFGFLVGDTGQGKGSRKLYQYLTEQLPQHRFETLTFHYLQPIVHWHGKILSAVDKMPKRPILIADAGYMYMAKMSGRAQAYDLFTPDVGELAFLADEEAPHPFYTRGFILQEENRLPDLIARAYTHNNAARKLLVKGSCDYLADCKGIKGTVNNPVVEALEAMGGTGDTLTGIVSALIASGMQIDESATIAAKANRLAGFLANPTPATQVLEVINRIPEALGKLIPGKQV